MSRSVVLAICIAAATGLYGLQSDVANSARRDDATIRLAEAASKISYIGSNRAYILVKETELPLGVTRGGVAVIYGYEDNGAACETIAEVMSAEYGEYVYKGTKSKSRFECRGIKPGPGKVGR